MKRLILSSLVIGIFVLASTGYSQESRDSRYIKLPGLTEDRPFSDAVLVGDTVYLSGKLGIDPATNTLAASVQEEVRIILDSMKQRLEMVGMTMNDLVSVQVFCSDVSLYGEFNSIYRTYFTDHFPARAFIGSGQLLRGGHFEVMGTAVKQ